MTTLPTSPPASSDTNSSEPLTYQNFTKINLNLDVIPLLVELRAMGDDWWDTITARTADEQSPFKDVHDIWLRYNPDITNLDRVVNSLESVNYPAWRHFPLFRDAVYMINFALRGLRVGRVLITKLPPKGKMLPHVDQGRNAAYYDRFHLCLLGDDQSYFHCGDETVVMAPGELWWFDNKKLHSVENRGKADRIHLIVDLRL